MSAHELRAHIVAEGVAAEALRLEGSVVPDGGGFRATLRVHHEDGSLGPERSVDAPGPSCAALTPAIVLVATMLASDAAPPVAAAKRTRPAFFEATWGLQASWGLLLGAGVGPSTTLRFTTPSRFGLLTGFAASFAAAGALDRDIRDVGRAYLAPLAACVDAVRDTRAMLVPCVGVLLGGLEARWLGPGPERRELVALGTLGARVGWTIAPRTRLITELTLGVSLRRTSPRTRTFQVEGAELGSPVVFPQITQRFQVYPALGIAHTF